MKNMIKRCLLLAVFIFSVPVQAGGGHAYDKDGGHSMHGHAHGPVTAEQVISKAKQTMLNLVKRKVIDLSWASASLLKAEKKTFAKGEEWVVSFNNNQIEDKSKQVLYIFYSLNGRYIAANYSGK